MQNAIGSNIRAVHRKLRPTQQEFAHQLGVAVATVNRWENGHTRPSKLGQAGIVAMAQTDGHTLTVVHEGIEGGSRETCSCN